jgi:hypothetical protein
MEQSHEDAGLKAPPDRVHLVSAPQLCGLAAEYSAPGEEKARVRTWGSMTSDHPLFYKAVGLASPYLDLAGWLDGGVHSCLVLIHDDASADVLVNSLPIRFEIAVKRPVKAGEGISNRDTADIRKAVFPNDLISGTDRVIFCMKVGWKFLLHFDLTRTLDKNYVLDTSEFETRICNLYRFLIFERVFRVVEAEPQFQLLKSAGWFPFIEIMADEFVQIAEAYSDGRDVEARVAGEVDKFSEDRLERMMLHWWRKEPFSARRGILVAGVHSFLSKTNDGDIQCIKTLITEIEGVARDLHMTESGNSKGDFWQSLATSAFNKAGSESSMYLPNLFADYLHEVMLANFDAGKQTVPLSRHTVGHGAAKPEQYTRARALQVILTLDQISYYI